MSKRIVQQKQATFTLEDDGFSIHTLELSQRLTHIEFKNIKEELYEICQEGDMYEMKNLPDYLRYYTCTHYSSQGIRLFLEHTSLDGWDYYYIRIILTPRKLLGYSYYLVGILPPEESAIKGMEKAFHRVFDDSLIEGNINYYTLSRVDFCGNISCDCGSMLHEFMRVLHKAPTFGRYQRYVYKNQRKRRKAVLDNQHCVQYTSGAHTLVIYDKGYQVENEDMGVCDEFILRFELQCQRDFIRKYRKKIGGDLAVIDLLWHMVQHSQENLCKYMKKCYGDMTFLTEEKIIERIEESKYRKKTQNRQKMLVGLLREKPSYHEAIWEMDLKKKEEKGLLQTFKKMGVSPVPLRKNFAGEFLFGPMDLLGLEQGEALKVPYQKVKYK